VASKKISILLSVDDENYAADTSFLNRWLEKNRDVISYNSGNTGCGCCVDMWEIECDEAAAHEIPNRLISQQPVFDKNPGFLHKIKSWLASPGKAR
jgi:hypothetical protein